MKLKATDTLHISALGPNNLAPGEVFEVSDATGVELVKRGLATEVKAAPAATNKMQPEPQNKAAPKRKAK